MKLFNLRMHGFWTFDLLIAVIILLAIFYIAMNVVDFLTKELRAEHKGFVSSMNALLLSERAVKRDFAKVESQLIHANVVDENIDIQGVLDEMYNYYKFPISVKIFTENEINTAQVGHFGQEYMCMRRFVIYKGEVGYLEMCTG